MALAREILRSIGLWLAIALAVLAVGFAGFVSTAALPHRYAMENAVSVVFGSGALYEIQTYSGKAFIAFYAIVAKATLFLSAGLMPLHIFRDAIRAQFAQAARSVTPDHRPHEDERKPMRSRARARAIKLALLRSLGMWFAIAMGVLAIGMTGFVCFEDQSLPDAFLMASIAAFCGEQIAPLYTDAGALFNTGYGIFSKLALFMAAGLMPIRIVRETFQGDDQKRADNSSNFAQRGGTSHPAARKMKRQQLARLIARSIVLWLSIALAGLMIGTAGFCSVAGFSSLDAFANASMTLFSGGPLTEINSTAGKIFVACYAIWGKAVLYLTAGLMPLYIFRDSIPERLARTDRG